MAFQDGQVFQLPLHPTGTRHQPQPQLANPSQRRSSKSKGKKARRAALTKTLQNPHIESLLNADVYDDVGDWLVVSAAPGPGTNTTNSSNTTGASVNSGGSVDHTMTGHDGEPLTLKNIQLLGIMNRDAAVTERLMRRSDMARTYYESLKTLGVAEMSSSTESIDKVLPQDAWGPVNTYSRSLELNGVGGWANYARME